MTKYRELILKSAKKYYDQLNNEDFSHDFNHILRVERLAKRIAESENVDIEIIEASCLLFDVARILEDKGKVSDHAEEGSKIAKQILEKINFPKDKIDSVCHAILVHRKSKGRKPETMEAKILQDADYLDALGAVDIARVIASSLQSKKYKRPIYVEPTNDDIEIKSAIHYFLHKIEHPKLQPNKFHTKLGRQLAKERFDFMKEFTERFIDEWNGKR
tara:strand:- start:212 stop:862 length:651 start_codon:yes stop_codon:yes gene_type:complete